MTSPMALGMLLILCIFMYRQFGQSAGAASGGSLSAADAEIAALEQKLSAMKGGGKGTTKVKDGAPPSPAPRNKLMHLSLAALLIAGAIVCMFPEAADPAILQSFLQVEPTSSSKITVGNLPTIAPRTDDEAEENLEEMRMAREDAMKAKDQQTFMSISFAMVVDLYKYRCQYTLQFAFRSVLTLLLQRRMSEANAELKDMFKVLGGPNAAKKNMPVLGMVHAHIAGAIAATEGKSRQRAINMAKKARLAFAEKRKSGWETNYASLRPYHIEVMGI
jgi:hypothetical protein